MIRDTSEHVDIDITRDRWVRRNNRVDCKGDYCLFWRLEWVRAYHRVVSTLGVNGNWEPGLEINGLCISSVSLQSVPSISHHLCFSRSALIALTSQVVVWEGMVINASPISTNENIHTLHSEMWWYTRSWTVKSNWSRSSVGLISTKSPLKSISSDLYNRSDTILND